MRFGTAFRLLTLICFALFGGAMPAVASGEHVVICGADGVKRVVAYDFETGAPVETSLAEAECQDCFGVTPILIASPSPPSRGAVSEAGYHLCAGAPAPLRPAAASFARGPPSLIL